MYLVFSAFTFKPVSLLAITKAKYGNLLFCILNILPYW